ncbi:MAG: hypothetical protein HUJ74_00075 [Lachnospiraceae bacterium]|nr:hypothetical protein [Lachnospiraceae bacterium]
MRGFHEAVYGKSEREFLNFDQWNGFGKLCMRSIRNFVSMIKAYHIILLPLSAYDRICVFREGGESRRR